MMDGRALSPGAWHSEHSARVCQVGRRPTARERDLGPSPGKDTATQSQLPQEDRTPLLPVVLADAPPAGFPVGPCVTWASVSSAVQEANANDTAPWGWRGRQRWNVMVGMTTVQPSVPTVPHSCQSPAPAGPGHRSAPHTWCRVVVGGLQACPHPPVLLPPVRTVAGVGRAARHSAPMPQPAVRPRPAPRFLGPEQGWDHGTNGPGARGTGDLWAQRQAGL